MADQTPAPARYDGLDLMPIAGTWRRGSSDADPKPDTDPYTGETLLEIHQADAGDVDAAYRGAKEAQRSWAATLPPERAAVLRRVGQLLEDRHEEIADWLRREAGGTRVKAELEIANAQGIVWESASFPSRVSGRILPAQFAGKENRVYRQPAGVVGVISPWNFPLHLSMRSVAPALALGNAVVLKPAGDTPVTGGLLLAKLFEEAGLPPGVLSVLIGKGSEIGDPIVEHPVPSVISFTGSTDVGRGIAQKAALKVLSLELGGNGPLVVLDDADLDYAVRAAVFGKYVHAGQVCMGINRIVVDASVHDEFVERFVERTRGLPVGDPADPETVVGPVINGSQLESVQDKLARAADGGAEVLLGGEPSGPSGLVLPPHVLVGSNEVATAAEEVFGPVATIIRARDEGEALAIANDTELGLSSSVFTRDVERGLRFALQVEAGMTHVNDMTVNDEPNTAFGGEKASGLGRFGGDWAIEEFTTDHWVSVQHTPRQYPF